MNSRGFHPRDRLKKAPQPRKGLNHPDLGVRTPCKVGRKRGGLLPWVSPTGQVEKSAPTPQGVEPSGFGCSNPLQGRTEKRRPPSVGFTHGYSRFSPSGNVLDNSGSTLMLTLGNTWLISQSMSVACEQIRQRATDGCFPHNAVPSNGNGDAP